MTQPNVLITELDGTLGVLPPSAGRLLALTGVSSTGPLTPGTYGKVKDVVAIYGKGPLVEAAALHIEKTGQPVLICRTGDTTAGVATAVVATGFGTSVATVTVAGADEPQDDYEYVLKIETGGTQGVAGVTFRVSLDGGRNWSPLIALGVAVLYVYEGIKVNFAAGTLLAGGTIAFRTTSPLFTSAELGVALDSLKASAANWEQLEVCGAIDATSFDMLETKFASMFSAGKYHNWIAHCRMPLITETESTYLAAMVAIFSSKATKFGSVCFGAAKTTSSVSGRKYTRPISFTYASLEASVSEEINTADVNLGPVVGVTITDVNGNVENHDESNNPGADDARFVTYRTWEGLQGVYVNRPRLLSPDGSDFQLVPHRRVMNLAHAALRMYFVRRLNKPVRVDSVSGFILEEEALEIEAGARAVMRAVLLAKPKASAIQFVLSRTDNLLSTKTMTGQARVVPLAYPEFISLDLGFLNPALQIVPV